MRQTASILSRVVRSRRQNVQAIPNTIVKLPDDEKTELASAVRLVLASTAARMVRLRSGDWYLFLDGTRRPAADALPGRIGQLCIPREFHNA